MLNLKFRVYRNGTCLSEGSPRLSPKHENDTLNVRRFVTSLVGHPKCLVASRVKYYDANRFSLYYTLYLTIFFASRMAADFVIVFIPGLPVSIIHTDH